MRTQYTNCSIAIHACQTSPRSVAIIGTDTDLLAILIARGIPGTSLYFLRSQATNYEDKCYNITKTQETIEPIKDRYPSFPARSHWMYTTSAIFRKGKSTAFELIKENKELCSVISQFKISQLDPLKIIEIGEVFLKHLFGGKQINSLDDLRYIRYNKE
ncbi:hypothetical protein AVEN_211237-1 [Araneus ventricosus]|uniref:Uncharacterized protein n=1 Tax=Araneus ventricosus TaxID=182803 RepID=A0A4Y2PZF1_ARAVE|nr:hypothetical protein AVEN_211237-1 [Araneus ventricosus]